MSQFGVDYDAAMAGATLQWRGLSPAMKRALHSAGIYPLGRVLCRECRRPTADALESRGLVTSVGSEVSVMGLLVRLAGIAESKRIEALAAEV